MGATADPRRLFTEKHETYTRFIRWVRYPEGLRAYFLHSPLLRPGLRVLDAGCGTGVVTLGLRDALVRRGLAVGTLHAFDLTPAMIARFRTTLARRGIADVEIAQADVLDLSALPPGWVDYDLLISASMLEYVPRARFVEALRGLRSRLREDGRFVLFMTRRNWLTRPMIGRWWQSNLYGADELRDSFVEAGFSAFAFREFPLAARHLAVWGYVMEATP